MKQDLNVVLDSMRKLANKVLEEVQVDDEDADSPAVSLAAAFKQLDAQLVAGSPVPMEWTTGNTPRKAL